MCNYQNTTGWHDADTPYWVVAVALLVAVGIVVKLPVALTIYKTSVTHGK